MNNNTEQDHTHWPAIKFIMLGIGVCIMILAIIMNNTHTKGSKTQDKTPYEYIEAQGYDSFKRSIEDARMGVNFLVKGINNHFDSGSGQCQKALRQLTESNIRIGISVQNSELYQGRAKIAHVKLQCIAYMGEDESCKQRLDDMIDYAKKSNEGAEILAALSLIQNNTCGVYNAVGQPRIVSY